jgi:enoyl-CoA hydratase
MEMAITAEPITAEDGARHGLITKVTPKGAAVDAALELAARVAKNAPLAVAASKKLINAAVDGTAAEFWTLQDQLMGPVFGSNDAKEGPRAFAEKRAPEWTGS